MSGKNAISSENSIEFSHSDLDVESIKVVNQSLLGADVPSSLRSFAFEVSRNPDDHGLVRVHSTLAVIVDGLLSISISGDEVDYICFNLSVIKEVRTVEVGSVVCLLEVLVEHFEGHLSHGLPGLEPVRGVVHLIVDTDPGVVDGLDSLRIFGKSTISVIAPISHGSVIEAPFLVIDTCLSGQIVGQHDIVFKDNLFFRGTRVDTMLHKRDVVRLRSVGQVNLSSVRGVESSRTSGPLSLLSIREILDSFHVPVSYGSVCLYFMTLSFVAITSVSSERTSTLRIIRKSSTKLIVIFVFVRRQGDDDKQAACDHETRYKNSSKVFHLVLDIIIFL